MTAAESERILKERQEAEEAATRLIASVNKVAVGEFTQVQSGKLAEL